MDHNDPQLLGEGILKLVKGGMKPTTAADTIYSDQDENGWYYGYPASGHRAARPALRGRSSGQHPPRDSDSAQGGS